MTSCCYILHSVKLGKFYIGSTLAFTERLIKHNSAAFGSNKFTSAVSDWEEFLVINCSSIEQARSIERHIKNMKSKIYINNLNRYLEMVKKLLSVYSNL